MMKRRRMHITICLSALLIASVGTVFLNQPSAPMRIPQSQTPGFSSGAASSNGYHAAMDLNQPLTQEPHNGVGTQRTTILLPEEGSRERVTLSASDFEMRKPSPPPGLSVNESTKSAVQNLPPRDGTTIPSDPFEEGPEDLIPPTTDVPVQLPDDLGSKPEEGEQPSSGGHSEPDVSSDTESTPEPDGSSDTEPPSEPDNPPADSSAPDGNAGPDSSSEDGTGSDVSSLGGTSREDAEDEF